MDQVREGFLKSLPDGRSLYYTWFEAMHSRLDMILCDMAEDSVSELSDRVYDEVGRIEKMLNRFDPESELSRLNSQHDGKVNDELFRILKQVLTWNGRTEGYFDVAVFSEPGSAGIKGLSLDEGNRIVRYGDAGIKLDLSGYAKGYALDSCLNIIREAGVANALANFGNSSVAALGNHPYGEGWKVGVESPWEPGASALDVDLAPGTFLTTSGNHADDRRHIVDPVSGGFKEGIGMVSVVTESGVVGEILSTALFAAPDGERKKMALLPECLKFYEINR